MAAQSPALKRCLAELRERGLLLAADAKLPSVTTIVAGEPVEGSWWSHAAGKEIHDVQGRLMRHRDVFAIALVSGKRTFVHRKLWQDLLTVASSRAGWQVQGLGRREADLLDLVDTQGTVRIDEAATRLDAYESGFGRELEHRLLALGGQVHTEKGNHVRTLTSWLVWEPYAEGEVECLPAEQLDEARGRIEAAAKALGPTAKLPWWTRKRISRVGG